MPKAVTAENTEKTPHNYTVSPALLSHLHRINQPGGRKKKPAVVADNIRKKILSSKKGMTSENLEEETGASLVTVRRVLTALKKEGLVEKNIAPGRVVIWKAIKKIKAVKKRA